MIQLPLAGGCQCGALRYRVSEAPLMVYHCHCTYTPLLEAFRKLI